LAGCWGLEASFTRDITKRTRVVILWTIISEIAGLAGRAIPRWLIVDGTENAVSCDGIAPKAGGIAGSASSIVLRAEGSIGALTTLRPIPGWIIVDGTEDAVS